MTLIHLCTISSLVGMAFCMQYVCQDSFIFIRNVLLPSSELIGGEAETVKQYVFGDKDMALELNRALYTCT